MYKPLCLSLVVLLLSSTSAYAEEKPSPQLIPEEVLKVADGFRKPSESSRITLEVLLFKQEKLESKKSYTVYLKENHRSLALFNSPGEQGQKALQLGDRFYLLLPGSRRPVRISPMQKLLGEAAIGDISTMTWSEDYTGEVDTGSFNIDNEDAVKLILNAKREGVTYDKVDLWVTKKSLRPLQANLYLKSGRIAKKVHFKMGEINGKRMINVMIMEDQIQKKNRTEIRYQDIVAHEVPEKYFNPNYLTRNNVE